ncbi:hypothetical protein SRABI27_05032 [Pedobacter sp. Bi27]|uniref:hypothetical protein n=1 Tax=Pedobacter sp. Bi27 TaxID=2822351 RepID=UPI001D212B85|nr:hypothetical protein [Pedobacter sp. Bi27]CAH0316581.1 hypothetical protein SRABI27_05032 [Pedobacter sp. Bi27]
MKSINTKEISIDEIKQIDLFIGSSGYEERSTHLASKLVELTKESIKVTCSFSSDKTHRQRIENDKIFRKLGFELYEGNGDDDYFMERLLNSLIQKHFLNKTKITILIDYSSMTRLWYASLLRCLYFHKFPIEIKSVFSYSMAKYQPPSKVVTHNIHVNPIQGFSEFSIPDKPTALIIGMGYERERAFGLTEYFDAEPFLFYNDNYIESQFVKDVEELNKDLINAIPPDKIYKYHIKNLEYLENTLYKLCSSLNTKYRVIIAPCGPKPFTLVSLLVSLRLNNVDVWRISAGNSRNQIKRIANGELIIYDVSIY